MAVRVTVNLQQDPFNPQRGDMHHQYSTLLEALLFYAEGRGIRRAERIAHEIMTTSEPGALVEELLIYLPDIMQRMLLQLDGEHGRAILEHRDAVLRRQAKGE